MSKRKVLTGFITTVQFLAENNTGEIDVQYTIVVDSITDLTLLHGIRGTYASQQQSVTEIPISGRMIRMATATAQTEVKVTIPFGGGLVPDSLLGQKIELLLNKGKLEIVPFDKTLYKKDPQIEQKNKIKAERKLKKKVESVYGDIL